MDNQTIWKTVRFANFEHTSSDICASPARTRYLSLQRLIFDYDVAGISSVGYARLAWGIVIRPGLFPLPSAWHGQWCLAIARQQRSQRGRDLQANFPDKEGSGFAGIVAAGDAG